MKTTLSITEVARHLAEYINRVVYRGERFILVRGKKPVAELGPVPKGRRLSELPDLIMSLPRLPKAEADAFAEDLSRARSELSGEPLRDPWQS